MKIFFLLLYSLLIFGCDGFFPAQDKIGPPSDHTDIMGGAKHKSGSSKPFSAKSDCSSTVCHQQDLKGRFVTEENQVPPSCYQCHSKNWDDDF